jgi:hypothetical protein
MLQSLMPSISRALDSEKQAILGTNAIETFVIVSMVPVTCYNLFGVFMFLVVAVADYKRRDLAMKHCSALMSSRHVAVWSSQENKALPTINYRNARNVHAWFLCRQVLKVRAYLCIHEYPTRISSMHMDICLVPVRSPADLCGVQDFGLQYFYRIQAYTSMFILVVFMLILGAFVQLVQGLRPDILTFMYLLFDLPLISFTILVLVSPPIEYCCLDTSLMLPHADQHWQVHQLAER